ncbi:TonB family protein [bacterium]|nr:TonB family protein [bacterium]
MSYDGNEEKTNVAGIIIIILITIAIVWFIRGKIQSYKDRPKLDDKYLTAIREDMFKNFDPSGITQSGRCIISFEINEEGWINKRHFVKKSKVEELNKKVYEMVEIATIVPKPPKGYTNVPIELEFNCQANEREVACYSKNIVKRNKTQQ